MHRVSRQASGYYFMSQAVIPGYKAAGHSAQRPCSLDFLLLARDYGMLRILSVL